MLASRGTIALLLLGSLFPFRSARPAETVPSYPSSMIWYAETLDGVEISARKPDRMFNPASVVKVATSLRALELLGPDYRFDTSFYYDGPETGRPSAAGDLAGNLLVRGGADPDFQLEHAFMVAIRLNRLGIREVRGELKVDDRFWIGWEKGSAGRLQDPEKRTRLMASRLRSAMDPRRWDRRTQRAWGKYAAGHRLNPRKPPRVLVRGGYGRLERPASGVRLVTHRSKPLVDLLRRFNAYSNNDIERLEALIGTPAELADWLNRQGRVEEKGGPIRLETSSGLGVNRMSPRKVVRIIRDLLFRCRELGVDPRLILPSSGCRPGTLDAMFPRLRGGGFQGSVVGKTGTLIYTDGGVSVLAGMADTREGKVVFCVAYRNGGRKRHWARKMEETWLLDLIRRLGGPIGHPCADRFPSPEDGAVLIPAGTAGQ